MVRTDCLSDAELNAYQLGEEWGADWHGPTPRGAFPDPRGPEEGTEKLLLGGHHGSAPRPLPVNDTMISAPDAAFSHVGSRRTREPRGRLAN
jgi:hypothetical protein